MKQKKFNWQTADGLQLFAQEWQPETSPRAAVCLVHGLGEHSGRYAHVASVLTRTGYAVFAFDLRGHGRSQGQRGHTPSFEALMDDVAGLLKAADQRFPDRPHFLYGHSLGGILVLNYALRRRPALNGVIATSAGLRTSLEQQPVKAALARLLGRLWPTGSLSSGLDPQMLSRDPEVVRAYINDPLVHYRITFHWGAELLQALHWVRTHAAEFSLPLLLMHGSADRLAFPEGSREFAEQVRGDCTLKIWEGLYHETHNEPEQGEVLAFLLDWLQAHTPT